ncbi:MAG: hypothetical protein MET45_26550 [Nostoc sp. LLA-1]|nr:hypothetical protein [Cyanocohniella sp. LLY]
MVVNRRQINGKSQHRGVEKAMSKPRKKQGNPDFRHRVSVPDPASEEDYQTGWDFMIDTS